MRALHHGTAHSTGGGTKTKRKSNEPAKPPKPASGCHGRRGYPRGRTSSGLPRRGGSASARRQARWLPRGAGFPSGGAPRRRRLERTARRGGGRRLTAGGPWLAPPSVAGSGGTREAREDSPLFVRSPARGGGGGTEATMNWVAMRKEASQCILSLNPTSDPV